MDAVQLTARRRQRHTSEPPAASGGGGLPSSPAACPPHPQSCRRSSRSPARVSGSAAIAASWGWRWCREGPKRCPKACTESGDMTDWVRSACKRLCALPAVRWQPGACRLDGGARPCLAPASTPLDTSQGPAMPPFPTAGPEWPYKRPFYNLTLTQQEIEVRGAAPGGRGRLGERRSTTCGRRSASGGPGAPPPPPGLLGPRSRACWRRGSGPPPLLRARAVCRRCDLRATHRRCARLPPCRRTWP